MAQEKTIQTNILLPESLWVRAKMKAIEERTTLSELIRKALGAYLAGPRRGMTKQKTGKNSHARPKNFTP